MSIFLGGGGSVRQEEAVWREAFDGVGSVLYWPLALPRHQHPTAEGWFRASLRQMGLDVHADAWSDLRGRHAGELDAYDLLFVGGGRTSRIARQVADHGFAPAVRAFVWSGGRYYGGSAGAILACERITIAALVDDDPAAHGMPGLGLLTGWSVLPHADTLHPQTAATVCEVLGDDLLVLPEAGGAVFVDGTMRPIGTAPVEVLSHDGTRVFPR